MSQQQIPPVANSIIDTAKRLGVGRTTIYELIGTHELRTFKVGSRVLIPESELQRFVAERMTAAP